jgi:hypothetical protein
MRWRDTRFHGALALLGAAALLVPAGPAAAASSGPTVSITSPQPGAVLAGTVRVEIVAAGTSSDPLSTLSLLVTSAGVTSTVGTSTCAPGSLTCVGTLAWNTTGESGSMSLAAEVTTASGQIAASAPVVVTIKSPPPSATVLSPAPGAVVKGTVTVDVAGSTDPTQSDSPQALALFDTAAGATTEVATYTCPVTSPPASSCVGELTWNTTGLSGPQVLSAVVTTANGLSATSAAVPVTVDTPPPTIAITSPLPGAIVAGVINVNLTGATDPSVSDYPSDLALYDTSGDSTSEVGDYPCLTSAITGTPTCSGAITWDTTTAAGPQTLTAVITTHDGRTETSTPVPITVWTRARLSVSTPPLVRAGNRTAVRGAVVSANDGAPLAHVLVRLLIDPAHGRRLERTTRTNARGSFAFALRAATDATDRLSVPATASLGGTTAIAHQFAFAAVQCTFATRTLAPRATDPGHCSARGLPASVPMAIAAEIGGTWHTLAAGVSTPDGYRFALRLPARSAPGRLAVRVSIAASRLYAATTQLLGTLVVS